jgi:hypothetical protein
MGLRPGGEQADFIIIINNNNNIEETSCLSAAASYPDQSMAHPPTNVP